VEVVLGEQLCLAGLPNIQKALRAKVLEGFVVRDDQEGFFTL
jgi:hypothetical protein